jgi:hypothetical protein
MPTWNDLTAYRGFLFIGDPHVSSTAPGRRIDDYATTVLNKLEQAAQVCTERRLVPVLLGDLIHRDKENSIALVTRLSMVLRKFPCTPIELDGNHGKGQFRPSLGDIEVLLAFWGGLRVVSEPGLIACFDFDGVAVHLYGCPHADELPQSLPVPPAGAVNILITHHDLAFEGAYPGAKPVTEVANCHMLVNGHMHKTMASLQVGSMLAHNPGNIEPLSLDVADHRPAVWEWAPEQLDFELVPHYLAHDPACFDLTGVQVQADEDTLAAVQEVETSAFADMLGQDTALDAQRTNDGSVLLEDLAVICETAGASEAARNMLESLIKRITEGAEQ